MAIVLILVLDVMSKMQIHVNFVVAIFLIVMNVRIIMKISNVHCAIALVLPLICITLHAFLNVLLDIFLMHKILVNFAILIFQTVIFASAIRNVLYVIKIILWIVVHVLTHVLQDMFLIIILVYLVII